MHGEGKREGNREEGRVARLLRDGNSAQEAGATLRGLGYRKLVGSTHLSSDARCEKAPAAAAAAAYHRKLAHR